MPKRGLLIIISGVIAKDKTSRAGRSRMEQAGDAAEKQMAFYLRRRYADDRDVRVFNDLRVERQDEVAQIDHLVLHKHGMIIVESKSVTGEVHINPQLEFVRVFGRKRTGMPSPIQQAGRQGALLRQLLVDHKEELRRKKLLGLVQGGFQHCPIQVLVAISDQGIIKRPKKNIPELHKADQIVDQVEAIIDRHRRAAKVTTPDDGDWGIYAFHPEELDRVTEFLIARHVEPASRASTESEPADKPVAPADAAPATMPTYLCTHCHSTNIEVRFGRSYYFKCLDCDGNTAIKNACRSCGGTTKTKKRGPEFSAVCNSCGHEDLFFRNSAQARA